MDASRRAPSYDILKLIVAIILLIVFLILWRRTPPPFAGAPSTTPEVNPVAVQVTSTSVLLPSPTLTIDSAPTDPLPSPTATNIEAATATSIPSPTDTPPDAPTTTPLPTPTGTPASESTPFVLTACEAATSRSRLQTGTRAQIVRRLNFRSSPGIRNNWLRTNIPGTIVEVVGGPECLPHVAGAYVWWQVKLPNGEIGWSAEGSIHGTFYFMEPVE